MRFKDSDTLISLW